MAARANTHARVAPRLSVCAPTFPPLRAHAAQRTQRHGRAARAAPRTQAAATRTRNAHACSG
jgi:hypothetical protein